jgi:hypothetical protein
MNNPVHKLLDWIDINNLCWKRLSRNPNAINLLKQNLDKIDISRLLDNPNILDIIYLIDTTLLEKELNRFSKSSSTHTISNINAIELLKNHQNKICWHQLSINPYAVQILKNNSLAIDWDLLSMNKNPEAIELLKENPKKINWALLCYNTTNEAIELLKQNPKKINWSSLSNNTNPEAIKLLKENYKKINWSNLSRNSNDEAIKILKQNPTQQCFLGLAQNENPEAIKLLKQNPYCISRVSCYLAMNPTDEAIQLLIENMDKMTEDSWSGLAINRNPKAIQLLKDNVDKLKNNYQVLSHTKNPYIIDLLKENQHLIFWNEISDNPNIFKLDYEQIKKNFEPLAKEIIEVSCNPYRIERLMKQYNFDFEDWFN